MPAGGVLELCEHLAVGAAAGDGDVSSRLGSDVGLWQSQGCWAGLVLSGEEADGAAGASEGELHELDFTGTGEGVVTAVRGVCGDCRSESGKDGEDKREMHFVC